MASSASPSETELPRSRAGSLLHGIYIHPTNLTTNRRPCGSWLASDGALPVTSMAPVPTSSLASRIVEPQLPQVLHSCRTLTAHHRPLVGVSLLAMASSAAPSETELPRSRAGSLLHGIYIHPTNLTAHRSHKGFAFTGLSLCLLPLRRRFRFVGHPQQSP